MFIIANLNQQQLEAVQTIDGPLLILAGAGTGKTTVLVHRIEEMIKQGIAPENILAITFTNKAAKELKERIGAKLGEKQSSRLWSSTFHSTCIRLLRMNAHKYSKIEPNFTIYDNTDSINVVKSIVEEMGFDKKEVVPKNIYYAISTLKNEMIDVQSFADRKPSNQHIDWERAIKIMNETVGQQDITLFTRIYREYEERLAQYNALDFDDIILFTIDMFMEQPEILSYYQSRFKYIMVDEYQDSNRFQYVFIKLLADKYKNIGVVGDDSQSIYKFRGADIRNILNFQKDYPTAKIIKLEENYRSTDVILQAANEVISRNTKQYPKNLFTVRKGGEKITNELLSDEFQEADYVTNQIVRRINGGNEFKDIAILSRTNAQTRHFEQAFIRSGIPYKVIGGTKFFNRKEIKDLVSYIKFIVNPDDVMSFQRIVNFPKRAIGPKAVDSIVDAAKKSNLSTALKNMDSFKATKRAKDGLNELMDLVTDVRSKIDSVPADSLLLEFIQDVGLIEAILEVNEDMEKKQERKGNISQLVNMASEIVTSGEGTSLEDFLEIIALYSDTDEIDNENSVQMMTVHASKGLEFPIVFGVGMEEGLFPHNRSIGIEEEIEEERRLFYVLITRAKDKLYLTNTEMRRTFGQVHMFEPSRFLEEFSLSLIE